MSASNPLDAKPNLMLIASLIGGVAVLAVGALLVLKSGSGSGEQLLPGGEQVYASGPSSPTVSSPHGVTSADGPPPPHLPPSPPLPQPVSAVIVGTCDEGGTCGVKQRNAPFADAPRMYQTDLQDGAVASLVCWTTGDLRSSAGHGSSSVWYRLENGAYVNSVYLDADPASVPQC